MSFGHQSHIPADPASFAGSTGLNAQQFEHLLRVLRASGFLMVHIDDFAQKALNTSTCADRLVESGLVAADAQSEVEQRLLDATWSTSQPFTPPVDSVAVQLLAPFQSGERLNPN